MWVDVVSAAVHGLGLPRLLPGRGPLLLMYHGLGGSDGIPAAEFEAQLDWLSERRRVVPLRDLLGRVELPDADQVAVITFDDGYIDFAEIAMPALAERGLHATVFVPAGLIGQSNVWDAGSRPTRRILDAAGLRGLDVRHCEVGAHGYTHCRIRGLQGADLERETVVARARLEEVLGRPVELFAFPYGQLDDFDESACLAVEAAGYRLACATSFGRRNLEAHRYRLNRVGIEPRDGRAVFARKIDGAYDWTAFKERLGVARRRLRRPANP